MSTLEQQLVENQRLVAETRQLLQNRPNWVTYPAICNATGLKYSWLNKFACSDECNGLAKVKVLHEYLIQLKKEAEGQTAQGNQRLA